MTNPTTDPNQTKKNSETMNLSAELVVAAQTKDAVDTLPTFSMVANSGAVMQQPWSDAVVIDLDTVEMKAKTSIRKGHYGPEIGHATDMKVEAGKLIASGVFSGFPEVPESRSVVALGRNGFPWEASVQGPTNIERVAAGRTVKVNGKTYTGPIMVARELRVSHVAILDAGADSNTEVMIAELLKIKEGIAMTDKEEAVEAVKTEEETVSASADSIDIAEHLKRQAATEKEMAVLKAELAEEKRVAGIERISSDSAELKAEAIKEGLTIEAAELKILRAERADVGLQIHTKIAPKPADQNVLSAAMSQQFGFATEAERIAEYGEQTVEAGVKRSDMDFVDVAAMCLRAEGQAVPRGRMEIVQAAASGAALTYILGNTARLSMLSGFKLAGTTWQKLARQVNLNDFQTHRLARLIFRTTATETGETGKIQHGYLQEDTHTLTAKAYARMVKLTFKDIANDAQNALGQIPSQMGMKAGSFVEKSVIETLLANTSSFFQASNYNYADVSSYPLAVAGLVQAEKVFNEIRNEDSEPLAGDPKYLVVPPALKFIAQQLMGSASMNYGADNETEKGNDNPFKGLAEVVVAKYLGALSGLTNASDSGYYLFGDPRQVAALNIGFYKGNSKPKLSVGDTPFDELSGGKEIKVELYFDTTLAEKEGAVGVI